jgi:hypothetical protein
LSSSDLETLRAYYSGLVEFIHFTSQYHDFDGEFRNQRGALIKDLTNLRKATLVAGVNAGASYETMTELLNACHDNFTKVFRPKLAKDGSEREWLDLQIILFKRLQQLSELIALCESGQSKDLLLVRDTRPEEMRPEAQPRARRPMPDNDTGLSAKQYLVLQTMLKLKATDPARRKNASEIASMAEGPEANEETFKRPIATLVIRGLVASKTGRGGGCWLTPSGRLLAESLR